MRAHTTCALALIYHRKNTNNRYYIRLRKLLFYKKKSVVVPLPLPTSHNIFLHQFKFLKEASYSISYKLQQKRTN